MLGSYGDDPLGGARQRDCPTRVDAVSTRAVLAGDGAHLRGDAQTTKGLRKSVTEMLEPAEVCVHRIGVVHDAVNDHGFLRVCHRASARRPNHGLEAHTRGRLLGLGEARQAGVTSCEDRYGAVVSVDPKGFRDLTHGGHPYHRVREGEPKCRALTYCSQVQQHVTFFSARLRPGTSPPTRCHQTARRT